MSSYSVVTFMRAEFSEYRRRECLLRAHEAIHRAIQFLAKHPERRDEVVTCEAFSYEPDPASPRLEEYEAFDAVYFFNEACVSWYEDIGLSLNIVNVIAEEELPPRLVKKIHAPYLPGVVPHVVNEPGRPAR